MSAARVALAAVACAWIAAPATSQPLDVVDAHLASAREHLRAARFEQAVAEAEAGLELLGEAEASEARSRAAELNVLAATAELAFGDEDSARRRLGRALRAEPELALGDADAPPKLRRALDAVREQARVRGEPLREFEELARSGEFERTTGEEQSSGALPPEAATGGEYDVVREARLAPPETPATEVSAPSPVRPPAEPESATPASRPVELEAARATLERSLRAIRSSARSARIERWEIRGQPGPEALVYERARQRIDGRRHVIEHVRVAGDPEAELRLLSIETGDGAVDRIAFHPASGKARRLGAEPLALLPESLPVRFEDLAPPRLADHELLGARAERLDGEPAIAFLARPLREPGADRVDRVEWVVAERDAALIARRWFRPGGEVPYRILRAPRWGVREGPAGPVAHTWLLFDLERDAEATIELVHRLADAELDPSLFTLARLRGASAPIPLPEGRSARRGDSE